MCVVPVLFVDPTIASGVTHSSGLRLIKKKKKKKKKSCKVQAAAILAEERADSRNRT